MRHLKFLISMEGSINRLQFWLFSIGTSVLSLLMMAMAFNVHPYNSQHGRTAFAILFTIALVVGWWNVLVVFTKRWHDLNRSGLWSLLWFIPVFGPFIVIGWLGFIPGRSSHRRRRRHSRTAAPDGAPEPQYRPLSKLTSKGSFPATAREAGLPDGATLTGAAGDEAERRSDPSRPATL